MYYKRILILQMLFVFLILAMFKGANGQTETPHPDVRSLVIKLLKCIEDDQYETFVEGGSDYFKSRISKEHFHNVSERLAQHLKNGYDIKFLTEFKQADLVGTLWKIEYRDGFDDALVKIFMENGKIAGLWFQ